MSFIDEITLIYSKLNEVQQLALFYKVTPAIAQRWHNDMSKFCSGTTSGTEFSGLRANIKED